MTTRLLAVILFCLPILAIRIAPCNAQPPDKATVERLVELGKVRSFVEHSQQLSGEQWTVIETSLESGDDVSVALATLFLQRINNERSRALLIKLGALDTRRTLLVDAVIKTGHVTSEIVTATPDACAAKWQELTTDPNPYARIAGAKALCAIAPTVAKAVLLRLEEEKSEISPVANRLRRELANQLGEEPPPPIPGFESIYTWFERGAGALASVQFAGGIANKDAWAHQGPSKETLPVSQLPAPKKTPEAKPTSITPIEEPTSSTPWSIIVVMIAAATGLLWFVFKRRS